MEPVEDDGIDRQGSRVRALRRRMPPDNQIPARVDTVAVPYRDEDRAVGLTIEAFTTGLRLTIAVRLARRPTRFPDRGRVDVRRHARRLFGPFAASAHPLQVGVVTADGRRLLAAEALHFLRQQDATGPDAPMLAFVGSRGDGPLAVDASYWLTPLPPLGGLMLVVDGPDLGLPPTTMPIDGAAIAAAVAQVTVLWPAAGGSTD